MLSAEASFRLIMCAIVFLGTLAIGLIALSGCDTTAEFPPPLDGEARVLDSLRVEQTPTLAPGAVLTLNIVNSVGRQYWSSETFVPATLPVFTDLPPASYTVQGTVSGGRVFRARFTTPSTAGPTDDVVQPQPIGGSVSWVTLYWSPE